MHGNLYGTLREEVDGRVAGGQDVILAIDIQGALPQGSPDDVRREVKTRMEAGKKDGGFIISTAHNILPDTPTENIIACFHAARDFQVPKLNGRPD